MLIHLFSPLHFFPLDFFIQGRGEIAPGLVYLLYLLQRGVLAWRCVAPNRVGCFP